MEKEPLIKDRSFLGIMTSAYRHTLSHFSTFIRALWLPLLVFSLCCAIAGVLFLPTRMITRATVLEQVAYVLVPIAVFVSGVWCHSRWNNVLNSHGRKTNFIRTLIAAAVTLPLLLLLCLGYHTVYQAIDGIAPDGWHTSIMVAYSITALLLAVLLPVPLHYAHAHYIHGERVSYFKALSSGLLSAFRHLGFLILVTLFVTIVVGIILLPELLPSGLLYGANDLSQEGVYYGDAASLPHQFRLLLFITLFLSTIIVSLTCLYTTTVAYYVYGSVTAKQQHHSIV